MCRLRIPRGRSCRRGLRARAAPAARRRRRPWRGSVPGASDVARPTGSGQNLEESRLDPATNRLYFVPPVCLCSLTAFSADASGVLGQGSLRLSGPWARAIDRRLTMNLASVSKVTFLGAVISAASACSRDHIEAIAPPRTRVIRRSRSTPKAPSRNTSRPSSSTRPTTRLCGSCRRPTRRRGRTRWPRRCPARPRSRPLLPTTTTSVATRW